MAQLIRVAQQNREVVSKTHFKMNMVELRKRSHLIVRLIPENISAGHSPVFDFVELCGSDFAASPNVASGSRASEKERQFATHSFNSLSQALLASAFKSPFKPENHSMLTRVLSQSMLSPEARVIFCVNLNATNVQIKHSVTALKFSQKIREAIQKRLAKIGRRQNIDLETAFGRDVQDIENELSILKQKLFRMNENRGQDGLSAEDTVLG